MSKVDDELTRRLHGAERPVEGEGLFEQITRRRQRHEVARKAQIGALAVAVLALTTGGFVALSGTFGGSPAPIGTSPYPVSPKENGLLAFADGSSLFTISPEGGEASRVLGIPEGAWLPAWSPDGTRVAVAIFPLGPGPRELWVADADGSNATKLAEADNVSQPSWSPDGSMILYAADSGEGSSIHLIGADGTDDRVIGEVLQGPDYFSAAFSPDGTQILFDKGTDAGFAIFVMGADGSRVTRLSAGDRDYDPSWSPDGTEIAFTREEDSMESDIFLMGADGTNVRRVTDGPFGDTNLGSAWAPDSTRIAYQSGRTGGPGGLVIVKPDGSDPREIMEDGVLGITWQPLPVDSAPSPSVTPEPSTSSEPQPAGHDIGIGFNLCRIDRLGGVDWFGDGTDGTAWTGTRIDDRGRCGLDNTDSVIAADLDGDVSADVWTGIDECIGCEPWAATDVDGNGAEELVVLLYADIQPTYAFFFAVPDGLPRSRGIFPIFLEGPGVPELELRSEGFVTVQAGAGEEGVSANAIRCETYPEDPVLVVAKWEKNESTGAIAYYGARLRLETSDDLVDAHFVVVDTFTPTATSEDFGGDGEACGVDFNPWN